MNIYVIGTLVCSAIAVALFVDSVLRARFAAQSAEIQRLWTEVTVIRAENSRMRAQLQDLQAQEKEGAE